MDSRLSDSPPFQPRISLVYFLGFFTPKSTLSTASLRSQGPLRQAQHLIGSALHLLINVPGTEHAWSYTRTGARVVVCQNWRMRTAELKQRMRNVVPELVHMCCFVDNGSCVVLWAWAFGLFWGFWAVWGSMWLSPRYGVMGHSQGKLGALGDFVVIVEGSAYEVWGPGYGPTFRWDVTQTSHLAPKFPPQHAAHPIPVTPIPFLGPKHQTQTPQQHPSLCPTPVLNPESDPGEGTGVQTKDVECRL